MNRACEPLQIAVSQPVLCPLGWPGRARNLIAVQELPLRIKSLAPLSKGAGHFLRVRFEDPFWDSRERKAQGRARASGFIAPSAKVRRLRDDVKARPPFEMRLVLATLFHV